jgi:hypothetical protein
MPTQFERVRGQREHERACGFEAGLNLLKNNVARPNLPLVVPDARPVAPQTLSQLPDAWFVLRVMTDEDVECELLARCG